MSHPSNHTLFDTVSLQTIRNGPEQHEKEHMQDLWADIHQHTQQIQKEDWRVFDSSYFDTPTTHRRERT